MRESSEVEILEVLPSLDSKKNYTPEVSSKVLQRLVFDSSEPSPESCTSFECLHRRRGELVRLCASRVYKIGMGVAESRKRYSNSWFAIWSENVVARSIYGQISSRILHQEWCYARRHADQAPRLQRDIYTPRLKPSTWHS